MHGFLFVTWVAHVKAGRLLNAKVTTETTTRARGSTGLSASTTAVTSIDSQNSNHKEISSDNGGINGKSKNKRYDLKHVKTISNQIRSKFIR